MNKYLAFDIDSNLHKRMKTYLFNLQEEKTIKKYVTELIEKDLDSKLIAKNKIEEEEFE